MPKAIWNNQVITQAPAREIHHVKGNAHFPLSAVKREYLQASDTHCPRKGVASYYDVAAEE